MAYILLLQTSRSAGKDGRRDEVVDLRVKVLPASHVLLTADNPFAAAKGMVHNESSIKVIDFYSKYNDSLAHK
jgi:hypothetical protein